MEVELNLKRLQITEGLKISGSVRKSVLTNLTENKRLVQVQNYPFIRLASI